MADEINDTAASTDKPLATLAAAERKPDPEPMFGRGPAPADISEPQTAAERMRAFEEKELGSDVALHNGQIERGSGSAFSLLPLAKRREYAALERLAEAEQNLSAAESGLVVAQAAHAEALAVADAAKSTEGEV